MYFLTGTDEHGSKAEKSAKAAGFEGKEKEFVDQIAKSDQEEQKSINVSFDRFIRTTDADHIQFCLDFWKKVEKMAIFIWVIMTGFIVRDAKVI